MYGLKDMATVSMCYESSGGAHYTALTLLSLYVYAVCCSMIYINILYIHRILCTGIYFVCISSIR